MKFYIDGQWCDSLSGNTMDVFNPATGELLDTVPAGTADDADKVAESSLKAFNIWRKVPMAERSHIQHKLADLMRTHEETLGKSITLELGRPLAGGIGEIRMAAELMDYYAEEGLRLNGEIPMMNLPDERVLVVKEPVGVTVVISPFNYPIMLTLIHAGAALMAGCSVIVKPSEDTPLTTLKLAELFIEAGYPAGVFNVVTGYGADVGAALVEHPIPRKIAFTGSTGTGQRIAALAAQTSKRVTLEMGGQSPVVVCDDADLEVALPQIVRLSYGNSGQVCFRSNRIYVQQGIYAEFTEQMKAAVGHIVIGNGLEENVVMGPMVNEKIYSTSEAHVADAVGKGATLLTGGERLTGEKFDSGHYFPPTVLVDTDHDMKIMHEETFGPVIGVMPFDDTDEVIEWANNSPFGLAAYVFCKDIGQALRMAESIEAGSVWVNNIHRAYDNVPFGGMKQSGVGRVKSRHALEEYMELKTIYLSF